MPNFLEGRTSQNVQTTSGKPMLHMAIEARNLQGVEMLLKNGANPNAIDQYQRSPLHTVVDTFFGCHEDSKLTEKVIGFFELLINNGADPNASNGRMPVLSEAIKAHLPKECIEYLIKRDANIHGSFPIPFTWTVDQSNEKVITLLKSYSSNRSVKNRKYLNVMEHTQKLFETITSMKVDQEAPLEKIRFLAKKADVTIKTNLEDTMLHMAIKKRNIDVVKILLECGADANSQNEYGTPLNAVVSSFSSTIRRVTRSAQGEYILQVNQLFALLIDKKADPNLLNTSCESILSQMIQYRFPKECIEYLIEKGANINQQDSVSLDTPLHCAIDRGNEEIIELLLSKGADLNAKNVQGLNPIEYTRERKPELVALIESCHNTIYSAI